MKIFGLAGRSGSGKTTLLVRLLPELRARGLTVSTLKHAHHGFDIDRPGKDSHRHREAGASEVMVVSGDRWALLHEIREEEPSLEDLIRRMTPVDLVLVEGFHTHGHPMIEVHRPSAGHRLMWHAGSDILAVASDEPLEGCSVPVLDLNDTVAIADFVMARAGLQRARPGRSIVVSCNNVTRRNHSSSISFASK
ncbi:molybdopterin-guanine dinucleotide biosynthesis protein B [Pinisolibacter sp.]|uniref:molybdopterin-guanine dinucleotide biosynthesis protein B n=1 Tax=Pinisolibacter sp. TaxID=2172024 RepID=UPI002FDE553E